MSKVLKCAYCGSVLYAMFCQHVVLCCRFYWRLHSQMPEPEQTLIKYTWPSLPNKVDAAYEYPEKDQVIIFSGGLYIRIVLCHCVGSYDTRYGPTALCFNRDPNVGFEWIQPRARLPKVHPQTGSSQDSEENRCGRAHRRHRENSALHRGEVLEVCGDDFSVRVEFKVVERAHDLLS